MTFKNVPVATAREKPPLRSDRRLPAGESPRILTEGTAWAIRVTTGRRVGIENINISGKNINYRMRARRGNMACMNEALLSAVLIVFLTSALPE